MINLLKHKPFLELLASCQPDQQQALLETASPEQVHCLCLCAENLRGKKIYNRRKGNFNHTSITSIAWQIGKKVDGEKSEYLFSMARVSWG